MYGDAVWTSKKKTMIANWCVTDLINELTKHEQRKRFANQFNTVITLLSEYPRHKLFAQYSNFATSKILFITFTFSDYLYNNHRLVSKMRFYYCVALLMCICAVMFMHISPADGLRKLKRKTTNCFGSPRMPDAVFNLDTVKQRTVENVFDGD